MLPALHFTSDFQADAWARFGFGARARDPMW
jgi:hypothetical protein